MSPRKYDTENINNEENADAQKQSAEDKLQNSLENLKLRGLIKANYLFNTVSRDKL